MFENDNAVQETLYVFPGKWSMFIGCFVIIDFQDMLDTKMLSFGTFVKLKLSKKIQIEF